MIKKILLILCIFISFPLLALDVGQKAPLFTLKNQDGTVFDLSKNKDTVWTVLYFYPKADTPGCTTQACAFRDAIKVIEEQNAKIYGISINSVAALKDFKEKYKLNFDLLSDESGKICSLYETKRMLLPISKRHTFILDKSLVIRHIEKDVDPAKDAQKVADLLKDLQKDPQKKKSP